MSFADRSALGEQPGANTEKLARPEERPAGDTTRREARRAKSRPDLSKQRSIFFEDAFQIRQTNQTRDRIRIEAIVVAEVRTNVIVKDEFSFINELSLQLSNRYRRPVSSIVVTLQHGSCMLFGGTFDPAYIMTISALPCEIQTTLNKRNAALLQNHMDESIGVSPIRGHIRFVAVPEENSAWNGKTTAGEIANAELSCGGGAVTQGAARQSPSKRRVPGRLSIKARKSSASLRPVAADMPPYLEMQPTPPNSSGEGQPPPVKPLPTFGSVRGGGEQPGIRHKKSFVATLFGRSTKSHA